jgi:outer membrane protein OmpA-like peptidoglycan-associated protein
MRSISTLFLMATFTACASSPPPANARTEDQALAAGGEAPCGTAQVFFQNDSSELDATARTRLDSYTACLSRHETDVIYVAGMTDPSGNEHDNLVLGRARALAVADYLHGNGVTVNFMVRTLGEEGALTSEPLWPVERAADVTAVAAP